MFWNEQPQQSMQVPLKKAGNTEDLSVLTTMSIQCLILQQDIGGYKTQVFVRLSTFSGLLFLHQELSPRPCLITWLSTLPIGFVRNLFQHRICKASKFLTRGARNLAAKAGMENTFLDIGGDITHKLGNLTVYKQGPGNHLIAIRDTR